MSNRPEWRLQTVILLVVSIAAAVLFTSPGPGTCRPSWQGSHLKGWSNWGPVGKFGVGLDEGTRHDGRPSVHITSTRNAKSDAVVGIYQQFDATAYRGKRLQLTGYVKASGVDSWSGLWMTVEDPDGAGVAFDNMENRRIERTEKWKECSIVLDVPMDAGAVMIGCALHGLGEAWVSDLSLKTVEKTVKTTGLPVDDRKYPVEGRYRERLTLAFKNSDAADSDDGMPLFGWGIHSNVDYSIRADDTNGLEGAASGCLAAKTENPHGFSTIYQTVRAKDYRGKKLRFSGYAKTRDVKDWAGLWMRVDGGGQVLAFDNMEDRPINGSSDWKQYAVVLEVPDNAFCFKVGCMLAGGGSSWFNKLKLEEVGDDVPVTGKPIKPMRLPRPQVLEKPALEFEVL
ncbi:MAG: hypothetical protein KC777_10545 [Cyanobacteria bacterium HKST-UBA02]|nr:hypothetical protein [Cyanobacteria bacterium HKST-UBA02]